jgi:transcriptional regulator with XRE-family HTH domain
MTPTGPPTTSLAELRTRFGISQERLGTSMGTSQSGVKKAEGASDPRFSTIRRFVDAIGKAATLDAAIEVRAIVGGHAFMIQMPEIREPLAADDSAATHPRAWRLRAWDDLTIEQAMLERSIIAISADEIGDVTEELAAADYRDRLRAAPGLAGRSEQAIGLFAAYWRMFRSDMRVGDVVAVPLTGRRVAIAEITGEYRYICEEREPRLRHTRGVRWLATSRPREQLETDLRRVVNAPGTICSISAPRAAERLRSMAG